MKYKINLDLKAPAYLQLYKLLRQDVISGVYPYKSKLPSKRLIAEETGVSVITVEHAYNLLVEEGYVVAKERSGFFVEFLSSGGFMQESEVEPFLEKEIKTPNYNKTFFPFSPYSKAVRKILNDYPEKIMEKSPHSGLLTLRNTIANYLNKNRGINATSSQIVIGSGAEYLYGLITELFDKDSVFAIENPCYQKIEQVYNLKKTNIVKLPLSLSGIHSESLKNCKANLLHISPYISYPSGISTNASKRHEYLTWAEKNNAFILEDDFESEFSVLTKPEETLYSLSKSQNVIYMNTFSKTIFNGLRIGYMVLPKSLSEKFNFKLGFYSCTVPTLDQLVLNEIIMNGDFERHINRIRRKKRENLKKGCE